MGVEGIAKRLDRFLMAGQLAKIVGRYRSWICQDKILDHLPLLLELDFENHSNIYPFKFNHTWMEDDSFGSLVKDCWKKNMVLNRSFIMGSLFKKMGELKKEVVIWEKKKKVELKGDLLASEFEYDLFSHIFSKSLFLAKIAQK